MLHSRDEATKCFGSLILGYFISLLGALTLPVAN